MSKIEEKKKVRDYLVKTVVHPNRDIEIGEYETMWQINLNDTNEFRLITTTQTSSCGSIQIKNLEPVKGYGVPELTQQEVNYLLEEIYDEYDDFNHFYFIDRHGGLLEQLFKEQGFTKVWNYLNYNSENYVHMWCLNRWTDDEIYKKLED